MPDRTLMELMQELTRVSEKYQHYPKIRKELVAHLEELQRRLNKPTILRTFEDLFPSDDDHI